MNILKSKVMTIANRLHKTGMRRTTATIKAYPPTNPPIPKKPARLNKEPCKCQ